MGIKLVINGETIDTPRFSYVPQQGSVLEYKTKDSSTKYDVILVHYIVDTTNQFNRGDVLVHLKETEAIKLSEEEIKTITSEPENLLNKKKEEVVIEE